MSDDYALVECCDCGEFSRVPWELLGDNDPREIQGYVCDACHEAWERRDDPVFWDEVALDDMFPLEFDQ